MPEAINNPVSPAEQTTQGPDPLSHPNWAPAEIVQRGSVFLRALRQQALITFGAYLISLIIFGHAVYTFVDHIRQPAYIRGITPSGWTFGGTTTTYVKTTDQTQEACKQILEASFRRTPLGEPPFMGDYISEKVRGKINEMFFNRRDEYMSSLTAIEIKPQGANANIAAYSFRSRLVVVSKRETVPSEVYFSAVYSAVPASPENNAAWKLVGLNLITKEQFYAEERDAERRKQLGLEAK